MATQRLDSANAISKPGGADLTGKELRFATINSDEEMVVCGADGITCGVIQEGKAAGLSSTASTGPVTKVIAGAAVVAGVRVKSDSEGRAITGTTNSPGAAITGAGAAGEVIEVQWL